MPPECCRPRLRRPGRRAAGALWVQIVSGHGAGQLHVLLDDVGGLGGDALGIEQPRAARSRGASSPMTRWEPAMRATTAERIAPWRSRTVSYAPARRAWRNALISWIVAGLRGDLRQSLVGAKWSRSTMGWAGSGALEPECAWLAVLPAESSVCQRGSTTQSMIQPGCIWRRAVTAGSACRISPMAPRRTTSRRNLDCVCKY